MRVNATKELLGTKYRRGSAELVDIAGEMMDSGDAEDLRFV
jgi:hypothetical protein